MEPSTKYCPRCKVEFVATQYNHRFCSARCRDLTNSELWKQRHPQHYKLICYRKAAVQYRKGLLPPWMFT